MKTLLLITLLALGGLTAASGQNPSVPWSKIAGGGGGSTGGVYSVGGALIQAYDISGFTLPDFAYTVASPDQQTIVLDGPGISQIRFSVPHAQAYLLEFCCERDLNQWPFGAMPPTDNPSSESTKQP